MLQQVMSPRKLYLLRQFEQEYLSLLLVSRSAHSHLLGRDVHLLEFC